MKSTIEENADQWLAHAAELCTRLEMRMRFKQRGSWGSWKAFNGIVPLLEAGDRFELRAVAITKTPAAGAQNAPLEREAASVP
jgi:hypothetical protein